jgi:phytol kinase
MQTALWSGAAAIGFIFLLFVAELVARRWSLRPELGRKLAHVSCGLVAAALPSFLPFSAVALLAAAFIPFMLVSRRLGLFPIVHSAERTTHGEIYFPIGILLAAVLVPHRVAYMFGVLVLAVADALASVVGQRYGRRAYKPANKTYVGSAAFLGTTIALGLGATQTMGRLSGTTILLVFAVAAAVTIEEALAGRGVDNIILPVSAAALFRVMI